MVAFQSKRTEGGRENWKYFYAHLSPPYKYSVSGGHCRQDFNRSSQKQRQKREIYTAALNSTRDSRKSIFGPGRPLLPLLKDEKKIENKIVRKPKRTKSRNSGGLGAFLIFSLYSLGDDVTYFGGLFSSHFTQVRVSACMRERGAKKRNFV